MKEKVIIHTVPVTKKGEINSFQIKLPSDAKKIIGIESTVKGIEGLAGAPAGRAVVTPGFPLPGSAIAIAGVPFAGIDPPFAAVAPSGGLFFRHTPIAGELRLQSHGPSNLFYSTDVKLTDANAGYGDFSQTGFWRPQVFTHGEKFLEDLVLVDDNSYVLSGTYRDRFGEERGHDFNYRVNVYVWYAIEK
ncbi:MAG: hypothetical protein HY841_03970 [Bacteroidetes bacterium]|nr:hypothetical protein [Bacteroidota bacterium]